nr:hypothetical protein [Tanacetum cinerariifolium]
GHDNAIDDDVDKQPVQDLALNVDKVFQARTVTHRVANEAGPSYDSDNLSEVQDHDYYQDVDLHADHTSDSNMIPYDQYVNDNAVPVVHSNISFVPNDAFMMIYNDMYEPHAQSVSNTSRNTVVENS